MPSQGEDSGHVVLITRGLFITQTRIQNTQRLLVYLAKPNQFWT